MAFSVLIDAFRLVTAPRTSHAIYISDLAKSLSTLDEIRRLYLLMPRRSVSNCSYDELLRLDKVEGVWPTEECYPDRRFRLEIYWVQHVIPRLVQMITDPVDWYIAPYHHPPILLPKKIRVGTVIHDVCGLKSSAGFFKTKIGFYEHLLMFMLTAVRSDVIIPISDYTKREFTTSFPFLRSRVSDVVYNCVRCETVDSALVGDTLRKYGLSRENYFLAFGSAGVRKGFDLVIRAYSTYKANGGQCKLVLIVPADYRGIAGGELIANGILDVVMVSDVESGERDALYRGAVALLFPSRCEGFGYPVVEAMRQGCPPIAARDSPAAEIVGCEFSLLGRLNAGEIVNDMSKYEHLDYGSRLRLRERLIARSLLFEGDNFGLFFLGAMKGSR